MTDAELTFTGLDGNTYPLVTAGGKIVFQHDDAIEERVNVVVPESGPIRFVGAGTVEDRTYRINGMPVSRRTWLAAYPRAWSRSSGKGSGDPLAGDV